MFPFEILACGGELRSPSAGSQSNYTNTACLVMNAASRTLVLDERSSESDLQLLPDLLLPGKTYEN